MLFILTIVRLQSLPIDWCLISCLLTSVRYSVYWPKEDILPIAQINVNLLITDENNGQDSSVFCIFCFVVDVVVAVVVLIYWVFFPFSLFVFPLCLWYIKRGFLSFHFHMQLIYEVKKLVTVFLGFFDERCLIHWHKNSISLLPVCWRKWWVQPVWFFLMKDIYYSVKNAGTALLYLINIIMSLKKGINYFYYFFFKYLLFLWNIGVWIWNELRQTLSPFAYRLLVKVREYPTRSNWLRYNLQ